MLKYTETEICFSEIPDEITLCINISNCQNSCIGCHSAYLKKNIGTELTDSEIDRLMEANDGVTCVALMGEGNDPEALRHTGEYMKERYPSVRTGLYSGRAEVEDDLYELFDYLKVGPYIPERGPLNKETTNQRLYRMKDGRKEDITYRFWRKR